MLPRKRRGRVSWGFFASVLLAALISPAVVLVSILLAAAIHECGHLLALRALGVPIDGFRLTAFGAVLYASGAQRLSYGRELLAVLAGPAINLACGLLAAVASLYFGWLNGLVFAGANIILCAYNLLPILPLDGGRALTLIVSFFFGPLVGDAVAGIAGAVCALALMLGGLMLYGKTGAGVFVVLAAFMLLGGALPQLRLAKNAIRV